MKSCGLALAIDGTQDTWFGVLSKIKNVQQEKLY